MNQIAVPALSPPTSASHVPTAVPYLRQLDGIGLTVASPISTQPQPVVSMPATPLRTTVTAGIAVNLSTAAIHAAKLPTIFSSALPYLLPFRRRDGDLRSARGRNLDTGAPQMDGTMPTSALVLNPAPTKNSLPPRSSYLAMNARNRRFELNCRSTTKYCLSLQYGMGDAVGTRFLL